MTLSPADIADIRLGDLQRRLVDDEPGRDIENDASNCCSKFAGVIQSRNSNYATAAGPCLPF